MESRSSEADGSRSVDGPAIALHLGEAPHLPNGAGMHHRDMGEVDEADLEKMMAKARDASALLKALSHETRLLMLCMLCQGERTVGEIEHFLGMQQAVVSQQLARLRMDRIVKTRRQGRQIYYSIVDPQLAELISVLYKMYCDPPEASAQDRRKAKA